MAPRLNASSWAAVLCAVDELHDDSFVSDQTWDALRSHFVDQQLIELVFLIGQYSMIAMALNSLGIQIESDAAPFGSDSHTAV
jgi:4-carboxymuconolactone decarboxylase